MGKKADDLKRKSELLRYAHDIRKFEIELLWKRSSFIWTLITAVLSGVILMMSNLDRTYPLWLVTLLSAVGLVLSISWYFLNRGGKYWQENWESVIVNNEDEVTGPMYKDSSQQGIGEGFFKLNGAFGFSPSKILINISFIFVIIWIVLLAFQIYEYLADIGPDLWRWLAAIGTTLVAFLVSLVVTFFLSRNAFERKS